MRMKLMALAAGLLAAGGGYGFTFVRDGVAQVAFEGADFPAAQLAVKEYARIVEKITGAPLPSPGADAPSRIAFALAPGLGTNDTYEIRVAPRAEASGGERLVLAGNNQRSCWFAMCDLLEQLGCRWFWEGEDGEFLPTPAKDLALANPRVRTTAAFPYRALMAHPHAVREMWLAHNRLNPIGRGQVDWGQTTSWGGHSFNWIRPADCATPQDYFQRYPGQWALMDGIRVDGNHCYTNPDTIKTFQDWILRFWAEHPEVEFLTLTARDTPIYCHCEACARVGDPSTLFFNFLNQIVAPAVKRYPDKRYTTIAYAFYAAVPRVRLDGHFILHYCMYDRCYKHPFGSDCPVNPNALKAMAAWKDALGQAPNVYGYHFDAFGGAWRMTVPLARIFQDEMQWARGFGVQYWFTEYFGGFADPKQPRHEWGIMLHRWAAWAAMRLMWNPDSDLDALRRDFCSRVYGAGGEAIGRYLALMETAWQGPGHLSYYNNAPPAVSDGFVRDPALVAQIDELFDEAAHLTRNDPRAAREVATEKAVYGAWRELATGPSMAARWTMTVPYSPVAPRMDGTGSDPVWEKGATEKTFIHAKRPCKQDPTWATVLRTDDALYLRVIGWGDTKGLAASKTKRDDAVYLDDGIELCLDPMNTRTDYYWICVNTLGNTQDALASLGMNINSKWNGEFTRQAKVYPDRWVIEVKFPYATFGAPKKGKAWLMGLNRCGPGRYESWTDATVHSPNSFRTLIME